MSRRDVIVAEVRRAVREMRGAFPVTKDAKGFADVSFRVRGDAVFSLVRLLRHCERVGGMGHSYVIVADPNNSEYREEFGFDGDGSDRVEDVKVNGVPVPEEYGR